MTIDTKKLRAIAEKVEHKDWSYVETTQCVCAFDGRKYVGTVANMPFAEDQARFIAAASPDVVLALIDELEARRNLTGFIQDRLHSKGFRDALVSEHISEAMASELDDLRAQSAAVTNAREMAFAANRTLMAELSACRKERDELRADRKHWIETTNSLRKQLFSVLDDLARAMKVVDAARNFVRWDAVDNSEPSKYELWAAQRDAVAEFEKHQTEVKP